MARIDLALLSEHEVRLALARIIELADELTAHGCPWAGDEPGTARRIYEAIEGKP